MAYDARPTRHESAARSTCNACNACPVARPCPAEYSRDPAGSMLSLPHAGKVLFGEDTPAFALYVVRAGCLKTVTCDADGKEHVRGFHFPDDMVGLDALGAASYPSSAIAVTPSQVCRISKGKLQQMFSTAPEQVQRLLECTSRALRKSLALSGDYTAEQRVAAFLVEMEARLAEGSGGEFELPMTRRDVANHLRLATETVCRVLGRFAENGWLRSGCVLQIKRHAELWELARPVEGGRMPTRLAA